jgi:amino acid adenylation domain-containing protein
MTAEHAGVLLSSEQRRLWFLDQYVTAPVNNVIASYELSGTLDPDAFMRAFAETAASYPVCHQRIATASGEPAMRPGPPPSLSYADLAGLDPAARREQVEALAGELTGRRIDLASGPVVQGRLLRTGAGTHQLIIAAHRAVWDRPSFPIFTGAVIRRYAAMRAEDSLVAPDAVVYTEIAAADQRFYDSEAGLELARSWRSYLDGVPLLELPTDRSRAPGPKYAAAVTRLALDPELDAAVTSLASHLGTAPEAIYRVALQVLLHRYTGQETLALGVAAERRDARSALTLGPVETWTVLRSELDADACAADLAGQASSRPDLLPFERLVAALDPPRDPSRSPLFQVAFATISPLPDLPGTSLAVTSGTFLPAQATMYDLEFVLEKAAPGRQLTLTFRVDLFDQRTAVRMLEHYQQLLRAIVAAPGEPAARLSFLTDAERHRILDEFNATDVPYPDDVTVQELFEEQVLRTPDARAVTFEGEHLTYRELNVQANQLAYYLRSRGVTRGTFVALCLERSLDMMVAVLGVLKSGGAYVPIDPAYPRDRLAYILADTRAPVLVTQAKLRDTAPVEPETTIIVLDQEADRAAITEQSAENPDNVNTADDLTYIVYTSGSTGRPKGVETVHRGVARLVINTDILELDERTSYLQISPLSFDACTLEIFGPLLNGGRVVLLPPGIPTPARVARTVREQDVDTLWLVAPLASLTIETQLADLAELRQFMMGGDVLSIPHVRMALQKLPHTQLVNGYGPTEVTAFSVSHKINFVDPAWPSVPIGRPMHNTTAYILDPTGDLAPIGVWGELCLGGPGVARGYYNRPDLNAERFTPDPFRPGSRNQLYRTGDRCRWLPDGTIQFHGRFDTQVKIDGLRVELGEIQSQIAEHESVGAAVVTAPVLGGRRTLAAYVVPADPAGFDPARLRKHLSTVLPSVMVPAHYVVLDTIPLTPNNKVDFRALPEPDLAGSGGQRPAESQTQKRLAQIWTDILAVPTVSLDDNFFDLGGHSLRAVPLIAAISVQFGVDLAVRDVFEAATLELLASRIEDCMLSAVPLGELEELLAEIE